MKTKLPAGSGDVRIMIADRHGGKTGSDAGLRRVMRKLDCPANGIGYEIGPA